MVSRATLAYAILKFEVIADPRPEYALDSSPDDAATSSTIARAMDSTPSVRAIRHIFEGSAPDSFWIENRLHTPSRSESRFHRRAITVCAACRPPPSNCAIQRREATLYASLDEAQI